MRVIVDKNTAEVVYLTAPLRRVVNGQWAMGIISAEEAFDEAVSNGLADDRENWLSWVPNEQTAAQFVGILGTEAGERLIATVEGGQVTNVEVVATPTLWLHIDVSGGDGQDPPGVLDDGTQAVAVSVSLRSGQAEGSPVVPVAGAWRIMVRDSAGGEYDQVAISLVDGEAAISYTPPFSIEVAGQARARIGDLRVLEKDLDAKVSAGGVDYLVRLAKPVRFKVYRAAV